MGYVTIVDMQNSQQVQHLLLGDILGSTNFTVGTSETNRKEHTSHFTSKENGSKCWGPSQAHHPLSICTKKKVPTSIKANSKKYEQRQGNRGSNERTEC